MACTAPRSRNYSPAPLPACGELRSGTFPRGAWRYRPTLDVDDLSNWPSTLEQARYALKERHGIDHVTLQPEIGGPASHGSRKIIKVFARR